MSNIPISRFIEELKREAEKFGHDEQEAARLDHLKKVATLYEGEDKVVSSEGIIARLKARIAPELIKTHFSTLDAILGGFTKKQLIVISAPTKSGKTSFCIDLTTRFKDQKPLWLPFEEPAEELLQKFLDRGEEPPMFYTPERITGDTLVWVEKKIIEGIAKFGSKVVFIDHLHFIVPLGKDRIDLRIGETMRALKALAKKWNVVIFIIVHLKKTRVDEQPTLEDLRDSSFVAQEADTVIMLWRESKRGMTGEMDTTNNVNVSVQANRRTGRTGNVKMVYRDGHFFEEEWTGVAETPAAKEQEKRWNNL